MMSYSQEPDFWTDDGPKTKSTTRGTASLPMVAPARAPIVRSVSPAESAALQGISQTAIQQPIKLPDIDSQLSGHVRHDEDPLTNAKASLLYSLAYIVVTAFVVGALLIMTGITDGDFGSFVVFELFGTAVISYFALGYNRNQGLHHSATGIAHAEIQARERVAEGAIDSQERIAMHAIDVHASLIEKRWRLGVNDEQ